MELPRPPWKPISKAFASLKTSKCFFLWDRNRQIQEYTDEQIFTTVYEQGSFEPVARIVQLASHIEQKRLTDIAYETRRFVRIGESEETINERIADKSQPLISIYHYHCNHL